MLRSRPHRPTPRVIASRRVWTAVSVGVIWGVALAPGMAWAAESPSAPAPTPIQTPAQTSPPTPATPSVESFSQVCAEAGKFIEERRPQKAVELVESVRASLGTPAPGADRPCQRELNSALIRISSAKKLAAVAAEEVAAAKDAKGADDARQSVAAVLALDADNPEARQLDAQLAEKAEKLSNPPGWSARTWEALRDRRDTTWSDIGNIVLTWLGVLLAVLFAVRIALLIFPVHDKPSWRPLANNAQWVMWSGGGIVASGTLVIVLNGWPFFRTPIALLVTFLGAVALAYGWSRAMRISVSVLNSEGEADSGAEGHVIALLSQLGGTAPRGVETPRGADTTVLQSAGLTSAPEVNAIVKALYAVAQAVVPATPWRVRVDVEDDDRHSISITRNGRSVLAAVVDRDELGLRVKLPAASGESRSSGSQNAYPDLHRMSAAAVLCALQQEYGFGGLCGAKNWRSLGLHYIATNDFADDPDKSRDILARAVKEDRDNRLARVALWNAQYRESTSEVELKIYYELLDGYVRERMDLASEPPPSTALDESQAVTEHLPEGQAPDADLGAQSAPADSVAESKPSGTRHRLRIRPRKARLPGSENENRRGTMQRLRDRHRKNRPPESVAEPEPGDQTAPTEPASYAGPPTVVIEGDPGDQALLLRVLFSRVAVGVNYWAIKKVYFPSDAKLQTAKRQLEDTNEHFAAEPGVCQEFAVDTKQAVANLALSVAPPDGELAEPGTTAPGTTPRECYLFACYHAAICATTDDKDDRAEHAQMAVEYLKRADCDPTWRRWRPRDPQLRFLIDKCPEYWAEFGRSPYRDTDLLDQIAELGPFRARLQALGVTTAQVLSGISAPELEALLGVPTQTALRITEIAKLANFQTGEKTKDLAKWRVDITRALLELGVKEIPAGMGYAQRVLGKLGEEHLKMLPSEEQLQELLDA